MSTKATYERPILVDLGTIGTTTQTGATNSGFDFKDGSVLSKGG